MTPGWIRVRNVSQPVMRRAYALFTIGGDGDGEDETTVVARTARPTA